jgi:hypothetical protein
MSFDTRKSVFVFARDPLAPAFLGGFDAIFKAVITKAGTELVVLLVAIEEGLTLPAPASAAVHGSILCDVS